MQFAALVIAPAMVGVFFLFLYWRTEGQKPTVSAPAEEDERVWLQTGH